jgi:hypothetical protein
MKISNLSDGLAERPDGCTGNCTRNGVCWLGSLPLPRPADHLIRLFTICALFAIA